MTYFIFVTSYSKEKVLDEISNMQKTFLEDNELAKYIGFQREHLWLVQERIHEAQVL